MTKWRKSWMNQTSSNHWSVHVRASKTILYDMLYKLSFNTLYPQFAHYFQWHDKTNFKMVLIKSWHICIYPFWMQKKNWCVDKNLMKNWSMCVLCVLCVCLVICMSLVKFRFILLTREDKLTHMAQRSWCRCLLVHVKFGAKRFRRLSCENVTAEISRL